MSLMGRSGRYLLGALAIGGFWFLNRHRPIWEEAARTIVVFSVIMIVLRARLRRSGVNVHVVPLIGGKAALVVVAAVIEQVLRNHSVGQSSLIVSVALGAAILLAGLLFDRRFFSLISGPGNSVGPRSQPGRPR